jgi:hypothetical protein
LRSLSHVPISIRFADASKFNGTIDFLAKDNYVACDYAHDIECSKFNIHG